MMYANTQMHTGMKEQKWKYEYMSKIKNKLKKKIQISFESPKQMIFLNFPKHRILFCLKLQ